MKKKLTMMAMVAAASLPAIAQQWIDVTDAFIQNPRYDGNSYAFWQGTPLTGANPKENAEHYEKMFDTYQDLSGLNPAYTYRLSLNAFYRRGSSYDDYSCYSSGDYASEQYARLYANTDVKYYDTGIALSSSGAKSNSLGGATSNVGDFWNPMYIPNNMEAAYYWFAAGHYQNSLEFKVGYDGLATIGIRKDEWISQDWVCIDNWRLEYWGEIVHVNKVTMSETSLSLVKYETHDLTATTSPSNATYRNVVWSSSNEDVATVDSKGQVTAVGVGSCTIKAVSVDNSAFYATCEVTVGEGDSNVTSLIVNELQASNIDMFMDPSFNYGSWIELYNTSSKPAVLGGLYITDDPANLTKFQLPATLGVVGAKSYKVIWFDHHGIWNLGEHNQVDFKLDYDGGVIIISDGQNILLQQVYPEAVSRTSYARISDAGNLWGITAEPTPGKSNAGSTFATQQLDAPIVDKDAQIFSGSLQICVNIPAGATLRYTVDGSTPTLTNGDTSSTGVFSTSESAVYRFRLFKTGFIPSPVVTRTYIYEDKEFTLPIISIVGSPEDFYGSDYGVFTQGGKNGRPGAGQTAKCNWNMDWDRPVNFEYLGNEGDGGEYRMLFNQEVDLSRCGGWSRAWTPYSFKLKASKQYYGLNAMNYQFFPDKPYLKHKTLQIRNGGNDNNCRIKDAALQEIVSRSGVYVDGQEWVPVMHYINGQYMGVINMREPNNKHFAYANYGIDTDEMDQFEISPDSGYVQMEGTKDAFDRLYELSKTADDPSSYREICELVDIDEYINYMAIELYLGSDDWPKNNVKGFRDVNNGKFHFTLFDLDHAFNQATNAFSGFKSKQTWTFDTLHGKYWDGTSIEGKHLTEEIEFVTIFLNLLNNEEFKKQFADRFCVIAGSVFEPSRCKAIVTEMAQAMEGPMSYYHGYQSWGTDSPWGTANNIISSLSSGRINSMTNAMASFIGLGVTRQIVNLSSNISDGKISVNGFEVPTGTMKGYLYAPATFKAHPVAGYRFVGWANDGGSSLTSKTVFANDSQWYYYDEGSLDGQNWKSGFALDAYWKSGNAGIGYGKNQATTTAGHLPTYYFRKHFTLSDTPSPQAEFTLNFTIDDGMIVYVNGTEAGRYNMPNGNVNYDTFASTYAPGNPDTGSMTLPASLFKRGTNVIAVEVHNNSTGSSDILWNAELTMSEPTASDMGVVSTDAEYEMPSNGTVKLIAVYERISDAELAVAGSKPVMINEVSAANTMYVNDYFKKNDWIELYNTTSEDIDIAGMYISDNADKPQKYQVPQNEIMLNTIIPAHGFKVVWADKLENLGSDIHASFKLAAEGGSVLINTAQYADTIRYAAHIGTQSFGRYPDGAADTYLMNAPTIGKSNTILTADELVNIPAPTPPADAIKDSYKEGGMSIAYVDGVVNVKSEDSKIVSLEVFSVSGQKVADASSVRAGGHFASLRISDLPQGIYVARSKALDGSECMIKFVIK